MIQITLSIGRIRWVLRSGGFEVAMTVGRNHGWKQVIYGGCAHTDGKGWELGARYANFWPGGQNRRDATTI